MAKVLAAARAPTRIKLVSKDIGSLPVESNNALAGASAALIVARQGDWQRKSHLFVEKRRLFPKGWRPEPESNRRARICSPLRNHSAIGPPPRPAGTALAAAVDSAGVTAWPGLGLPIKAAGTTRCIALVRQSCEGR